MQHDNAHPGSLQAAAEGTTSTGVPPPRPSWRREPAVLTSGASPRPGIHEAQVLCWDDFLPAPDRDALYEHVVRLGRSAAQVATTYGADGTRRVRPELRRARSTLADASTRAIVEARLAAARDHALAWFQLTMFPMGRIEMEVTASGEGDYFRKHSDDSHPDYFSRILSYVLYLHVRPRRFGGGALRVYDSQLSNTVRSAADTFVDVDPLDNRLVIFPSDRTHELMPVSLDSDDFGDCRITINGACWCDGDAAEVMERWRAENPAPRP